MNASVVVFDYRDGKLTPVQTVPMTAPGFKGKIGGGAIHLSPDGRFLYATNRGDANEIVTFAVDPSEWSSEAARTPARRSARRRVNSRSIRPGAG